MMTSWIRSKMKRNNGGFTIMELVVAIGILGSLTAMTASLMGTSSDTYQNVSVESQLQSEAQLVANAISEVVIDAQKIAKFSETVTAVQAADSDFEVNHTTYEGDFLAVWLSDTQVRFIARKNDELYMFDATATPAIGGGYTFTTTTPALLGQHVSGFRVNTTRAADHRIIDYSMTYARGGRTYVGDYQIFMRNGSALETVSENTAVDEATIVSATVSPKVIYIDVYGKEEQKLSGRYYKESLLSTPSNFISGGEELDFTANVIKPGFGLAGDSLHTYTPSWSFGPGAPTAALTLLGGGTEDATLQFDNSGAFKYKDGLTAYQFQLNFEAEGVTKDEEGNVTDGVRRSDFATIFFRLCKDVFVEDLPGANISLWKDEFTNPKVYKQPAVKDNSGTVKKYVKPGSTITLTGRCDSPNVPDDLPVWKLEYRQINQPDSSYIAVPSASYAALGNSSTAAGSNTVKLGALASNSYVFRVTCTSSFDDTVSKTFEFGVQPAMDPGDDSGFYSRGYRIDFNKLIHDEWPGDGYHIEGIKDQASDFVEPREILYLRCKGITASNINFSDDDLKKVVDVKYITSPDPGIAFKTPKVYFDYQIFNGPKKQKEDFYTSNVIFHFVVGYIGVDDKYYIIGGGNDADKTSMKANQPSIPGGANITLNNIGKFDYRPGAVSVTAIDPQNAFVLLDKGESRTIGANTKYYNIMRPVNNNYYFGAYLGDMSKNSDKTSNLLVNGKGESNGYFSIAMASDFGDVDKYVENGYVTVGAKSITKQKKFLTKPMTLRLTANDFYTITMSNSNSWKDFEVLITNVMDSDIKTTAEQVYIPVPVYDEDNDSNNTPVNQFTHTGKDPANGDQIKTYVITAPNKNNMPDQPGVPSGTVKGIAKDGSFVYATMWHAGKKIKIKYNEKVYDYNPTYKCWVRS